MPVLLLCHVRRRSKNRSLRPSSMLSSTATRLPSISCTASQSSSYWPGRSPCTAHCVHDEYRPPTPSIGHHVAIFDRRRSSSFQTVPLPISEAHLLTSMATPCVDCSTLHKKVELISITLTAHSVESYTIDQVHTDHDGDRILVRHYWREQRCSCCLVTIFVLWRRQLMGQGRCAADFESII